MCIRDRVTTATNGVCTAVANVNNAKAYMTKTTGGCAVGAPSTATGAVAFENEQTICCQ